jgi:hypothetical protein
MLQNVYNHHKANLKEREREILLTETRKELSIF